VYRASASTSSRSTSSAACSSWRRQSALDAPRTATCYADPADGHYAREAAVAWADLRWPPETDDRWGDSP